MNCDMLSYLQNPKNNLNAKNAIGSRYKVRALYITGMLTDYVCGLECIFEQIIICTNLGNLQYFTQYSEIIIFFKSIGGQGRR